MKKSVINIVAKFAFLAVFLVFTYNTYQESKIWIFGTQISTEIVNVGKIKNDKYFIDFQISDKYEVQREFLSKKEFNAIKPKDSFGLRYLSDSEYILTDLKSGRRIFGLVLGMLFFGFGTYIIFKNGVPVNYFKTN
ncbi:hypothetical protein GCM10027429_20120 [Marivirga atlantica]|jgi:hypothetical protein|uniref:Uncharacterized protein n=1 Tax=Marivirga atlantica TaxID=1548457 RepID=A0A937AF83_9BACT|nr:hypothetical protein [Marivirga atlantica]MBL0765631.1 hypothetical protein [Marivirga atlantica]